MSGILSRLVKLGLAKEATPYTYTVPTVSIPFNTGTKYVDSIIPLRDESYRNNDVILQGLVQGPAQDDWSIGVNGYSDLAGHWFRAMIGPDVVTAGVSTTLASNSAANATSLTLTATVPTGSVIQISDSAGANLEYVKVTTIGTAATVVVGGGTGGNSTKFAHTAAGGTVLSPTLHTFKQNRSFFTVWPTYSLTTDDGVDQLGWAGCVMSELGIKIDPKSFITFAPKYTGMPSSVQSTFAYAASGVQPQVGWGWTVTNAGAASTRGLTADLTLKRPLEVVQSSDGTQAPRELFAGAMEIDGTYKAIFESDADLSLFKSYVQSPTVHTLTQPVLLGGQILAITMTSSGYTTGEKDVSTPYLQLAQAFSGIGNTTDGGVASVALTNWVTTQY